MKLQKPNKWNKTTKNRIWNGSILAAFIAAAAVFAVMLQTEKRTLAEYEKKEVYVAATDIPRGEELTQENIEDYVMSLEIDQRIVPGTAVTDGDSLYGRITVCDIGQGSVITGEMTESKEQILGEMVEPVIAGFRAEDLYQAVGGVLRAGDRIHIYCIDKDKEEFSGENPGWQNLFVQQVFDQSGNIIPCEDTTTPAQRVNIYLDNKNVEEFYRNLAKGSLRVVKICN